MIKRIKWLLAIILIFTLVAIIKGERFRNAAIFPPQHNQAQATIYVVDHSLHAGLILPTTAIRSMGLNSEKLNKAINQFPNATWLEIGWGDRDFYQAGDIADIPVTTMIKAAFIPTTSVFHIVGFQAQPEDFFTNSDMIKLSISTEGLTNILKSIDANLASSQHTGFGLYGDSRFFDAKPSYHMFNICNHWVAEQLNLAGIPINVTLSSYPFVLLKDLTWRAGAIELEP